MREARGLLPIAVGVVLVLALTLFSLVRLPKGDADLSKASDDQIEAPEIISEAPQAVENADQPKKWVLLGDSLTEKNFRASVSYYDYVSEDLGCEVVNYGVGSTGYMEAGLDEPFYQRVSRMDVSDADCVTIFGSFNDLGKGFPLGSADDETADTIGGCMNITIRSLKDANPSVPIGIVTPTRWRTGYGFVADGSESYDAITPDECDAYVALLREVAERNGLPVLDLYVEYGLDPDDEETRLVYYTEDGLTDDSGVHPNSEGHYLMYPAWREFVRSLMS